MKAKTFLILFLLPVVALISCEDIFEKDLGAKQLKILAPSDNYSTSISAITFWWEWMKGADYYRLQIAKPSFAAISQLITDTTTTKDKLTFSLLPGTYEWRVKACNNSSATPFITYTLTIDSTEDLSQQTILLISPSDKDTTNQTFITFQWQTLYNADDYRMEIWSPDFSITNIFSTNIVSNSINYSLTEGSYEWGVRGQNSTTNTVYFKRKLYIDPTAPNDPVLLLPANNAVLNDTVISISWNHDTANGSSIKDSLYIYSDSLMTSFTRQEFLNSTSYSDSLGTGTFFWRVRSIDAAGNYSGYSMLRKFTVQ